MKTTLTLICYFFLAFHSYAQVYVGDITLATQEEVDNFSTNFPGITYVEGTLLIGPYNEEGFVNPILNLYGLSQLTGATNIRFEIGLGFTGWAPTTALNVSITSYGQQFISNGGEIQLEEFTSGFTELNKLFIRFEAIQNPEISKTIFENLTSVDSLTIHDLGSPVIFPNLNTINYLFYSSVANDDINQSLVEMPSVNSLHTLISNNTGSFVTISTPLFSQLEHLEIFQVYSSDILDGFIGLSSLNSIGTFQTITTYLSRPLEGFSNIRTADAITVSALYDEDIAFSGLESLESVGNLSFWGWFNGSLHNLSNLQTIGSLEIYSSEGLTSLEGLENVTITDFLTISGSDLSVCNIPSICNFLSSHGPESYIIDTFNPMGCSTDEEILASCGDPSNSAIYGRIYFDSNCNGVVDNNEFSLSPYYVQAIPPQDTFHGLENFYISVSPQTNVTIAASNLPDQYEQGLPISLITPQYGGNVYNQNILVCPAFDFTDLQISIVHNGNLSPGFSSSWKIQVLNVGTTTIEYTTNLTFNSLEFISFIDPLEGILNDSILSWPTSSISPGQTMEFDFNITLLPTATILGETFSASAEVALVSGNDENPADNRALFEQEIIGSYDPNDKWVNTPQINIETIDPTQPLDLTYRVRFQNTGTAPAVNVRVEDILEDDLDPSTFQLLSSTHEVFYQIEGNQINFFFDNIMLPDSTSDPEGSIGTFFFRIKSNGNHSLESSIDNQVSIFFDFNEPIITNVASTIFYNCPVVNISGEGVDLCAGEEVELSAVAANNTSIQWFINEEVVSSSNNYLFSFDTPNDYSVLVVAENEYCFDEDELEITVNENPEVILIGDGNTLVATEGFASYQWTLDGNIIEGENGNTITSAVPGNYVVTVTNEFGCTDESDAVEIVDGINENESKAIVLWPNPVKDVVNIQSYYRGVATIVDTQGKQVMNITLNGQTSLDLSNLRSGVYQITSSIGMMGRFIKE